MIQYLRGGLALPCSAKHWRTCWGYFLFSYYFLTVAKNKLYSIYLSFGLHINNYNRLNMNSVPSPLLQLYSNSVWDINVTLYTFTSGWDICIVQHFLNVFFLSFFFLSFFLSLFLSLSLSLFVSSSLFLSFFLSFSYGGKSTLRELELKVRYSP